MRGPRPWWKLVPFLAVLAATPAAAQSLTEAEVTQEVASHTSAIALQDGRLSGPGADEILKAASGAEFVAIGEEHNNFYIPQITAALFRELHARDGYNFLALEQDPLTMRQVSAAPLRGNEAAIRALARRRKFGFTFVGDQDLTMIAEAGRVSTTKGRPVWGCEQAFGATHLLEVMRDHAPDPKARALAETELAVARREEAHRDEAISHHYLDGALGPVVARLQGGFKGADSEARFALDAFAKSNEIYGYYKAGDRHEMPGYWSNSKVREDYLKDRCAEEYKAAVRADGRPPKALMKFGLWHVLEAGGPANTSTLGGFMAALARFNGQGFVSIAIFPSTVDGKPVWTTAATYLKPFAASVRDGDWTVLDLRPFREYPRFLALNAQLPKTDLGAQGWLRRLVYGVDFIVWIGPAKSATYTAAGLDPAPPRKGG